jgi:6-pyruvoyltetrahydropterin/6-carboxytetrahydropterin synthase
MILRKDDPILPELRRQNEPVHLVDFNPTAENIAKMIYDYAVSQGFPVVEVVLWETEEAFASYRGSPAASA